MRTLLFLGVVHGVTLHADARDGRNNCSAGGDDAAQRPRPSPAAAIVVRYTVERAGDARAAAAARAAVVRRQRAHRSTGGVLPVWTGGAHGSDRRRELSGLGGRRGAHDAFSHREWRGVGDTGRGFVFLRPRLRLPRQRAAWRHARRRGDVAHRRRTHGDRARVLGPRRVQHLARHPDGAPDGGRAA